jgi:hypothetical protein
VERQLNEKVESILAGVRPSLGGVDVRLKDISRGVVRPEYHRPLSNPSACHVGRTKATEDIVVETLQGEFRRVVLEFEKAILLGEERIKPEYLR